MQFIAHLWLLWLIGMIIFIFLGVQRLQRDNEIMQQEVINKFQQGKIGLPKARFGFVSFILFAIFFGVLTIVSTVVNLINLIKA